MLVLSMGVALPTAKGRSGTGDAPASTRRAQCLLVVKPERGVAREIRHLNPHSFDLVWHGLEKARKAEAQKGNTLFRGFLFSICRQMPKGKKRYIQGWSGREEGMAREPSLPYKVLRLLNA
jgi:hypothetical protein